MTLVRLYDLKAREAGDALPDALAALSSRLRSADGCEGTELLRAAADPSRWLFVERWRDDAARSAAGAALGAHAFAAVLAAIDGRPVVSDLATVALPAGRDGRTPAP